MMDNQSDIISDHFSSKQPKKRRPTEDNESKLSDHDELAEEPDEESFFVFNPG